MQPKVFVEVGQRFGRGVVVDPDVRVPLKCRDTTQRGVVMLCDCGTGYTRPLGDVRRGLVASCGCLRAEVSRQVQLLAVAARTTHGLHDHPLYVTWYDMVQRCGKESDPGYRWYGARGIEVCERWHDVQLFVEDIERDLGSRPEGMTLDRVDNDGNYEPGNVRWATRSQQIANRRPSERTR